MHAFPFSEKLGEVCMVQSLIATLGQGDNSRSYGSWRRICRQTGPIPVGKGSGTLLLIRRQNSPRVALTYPEKLRRLCNSPLPFQHPIHDT